MGVVAVGLASALLQVKVSGVAIVARVGVKGSRATPVSPVSGLDLSSLA